MDPEVPSCCGSGRLNCGFKLNSCCGCWCDNPAAGFGFECGSRIDSAPESGVTIRPWIVSTQEGGSCPGCEAAVAVGAECCWAGLLVLLQVGGLGVCCCWCGWLMCVWKTYMRSFRVRCWGKTRASRTSDLRICIKHTVTVFLRKMSESLSSSVIQSVVGQCARQTQATAGFTGATPHAFVNLWCCGRAAEFDKGHEPCV